MVNVSETWSARQAELLAPEGFVEISYLLSHDGLQEEVTATSETAAEFAATHSITDTAAAVVEYAVPEWNLWILDGRAQVLPDEGAPEDSGYVGADPDGSGGVLLQPARLQTAAIPGITITWSGGYAVDFTVTARNGTAVAASRTVTRNAAGVSAVDLPMRNYDAVEIAVLRWSLPDRRARIKTVELGLRVTFGKQDILSFEHTQTVCLCSGELPKNSIRFSLENLDGRWDPRRPDGVERYLSERQRMTVRYGFDLGGSVEWIRAGTFYLSDWKTPANGIEATFEARDLLEYLLDEPYKGITAGTLYEIAKAALGQIQFPCGTVFDLDPVLQNYSADFSTSGDERTVADVLQSCANAACCVLYQDRDGVFHIAREKRAASGCTIGRMVEYSYPEFRLTRPLKQVEVTGGTDSSKLTHTLGVGDAGETQTVSNELISTVEQAAEVAAWVAENLKTRTNLSGEYRADPRLDVLDTVAVETRFGTVQEVVLTGLTYTFAGAFRGRFEGYIPADLNAVAYYSGEICSGEVSG